MPLGILEKQSVFWVVYCPALNKVKKSLPLFLTCLNLPMSWGEGWDVWIELPKHRAPREVTAFSL